jgi:hypothetical protein
MAGTKARRNNGMMEYWNYGIMGPIISLFQHSIIPTFHRQKPAIPNHFLLLSERMFERKIEENAQPGITVTETDW